MVVADGRHTLHARGEVAGLAAEIDNLHFAAQRLATGFGSARSRTAMHAASTRAGAALQERLLGPVLARHPGREVVLVPSASLHGVVWPVLPALWARPFVVAPSAAAWLQAASRPSKPAGSGAPVLVLGPDLPAAGDEIDALAARAPDAVVFRHPEARAASVLAAMAGAPWAHIAAHGALRTDNPLFSALLLSDGPLTIYDIEGVHSAPDLMVLSSCESGVSSTRAGDELLGLVAALLSIGTRDVIATALRTPDVATRDVMLLLHSAREAGVSAAVALARTRAAIDPRDLSLLATAAGFTCFGA